MANPYTDWISPFTGSPYFDAPGGGGAGTATAKKPKPPSLDQQLADEQGTLRKMAGGIGDEENRRYQSGLGISTAAFNEAHDALSHTVDPDLLFSKAADAIGSRASGNLEALRSSLGARGLNPNSGVANGMLSRILYDQGNSVVGAIKDTNIENQQERQKNAAMNFANALQLTNEVNAPVSQIGLDTENNIYEGLLTQKGIANAKSSQKKAGKASTTGAAIGAGGSLLAGFGL